MNVLNCVLFVKDKLKLWRETCFALITDLTIRKLRFAQVTTDVGRNSVPLITRNRVTVCVLILPLINDVIRILLKEGAYMALVDLGTKRLGEYISDIDHTRNMTVPEDLCGNGFSDLMVCDSVMLFL